MRAHPPQIVLMNTGSNDSPSDEVVLTADRSGALETHVRPGLYHIAFVVGQSGMLTNQGGGQFASCRACT
jgi:hypothetical protein